MTKEKAIKKLEHYRYCLNFQYGWYGKDDDEAFDMAIKALSAENTAEWISHEEDDLKISEYQCSKCDYWTDYNTKYCPNCGRKMKGAEE